MITRSHIQRYITIAICIICTSCGITRHIPEGEYLLRKVEIKHSEDTPKQERISEDVLERYIRQSPNTRLFGFNFYIWVYNQANPDKENWWNNIKRNIGEEPTYVNEQMTRQSDSNIKTYLNSQGYYSAQSSFTIDTTLRRKRAKVIYDLELGDSYTIESLKYEFQDTLLAPYVLADTLNSRVKIGDIFSVALLDTERERITSNLRSKGYYDFTVSNIEYRADTLGGNNSVRLWMIVKETLQGYDNRGQAMYGANKQYVLSSVNVLPNFDATRMLRDSSFINTVDTLVYRGLNIISLDGTQPNVRQRVLRQMVPLNPGSLYNSQGVEQTYKNLMSLGYFRSAKINFLKDTTAYDIIPSDSTQQSPIGFLTSNILCTPALRQSYDIQLEASSTSSFYGVYLSVGYQNRNIFRGAESWDINFTTGYEYMRTQDAIKRNATEVGVSTGMSFPRFMFIAPTRDFVRVVQPKTSVELAVSFQDRLYYNRALTSASWSYSWRNKGNSSYQITPIDINVINMKYMDETYFDALENDYLLNSYMTQLVAGLTMGYAYNNQMKNLGGNSTMFRVNMETAGNALYGLYQLFSATPNSDDNYEILGIPYAQYVRTDVNVSRKWSLGGSFALAGRLFGGFGYAYGNSTSIPFDRMFYSGGSNSMRGWTPRTLGPGAVQEMSNDVYPSQVGDMKLEANLEFRFPVWGNLHGATFLDAGNIWYLKDSEGVYDSSAIFHGDTFIEQLGLNTGLGVRLDIQFAILRLDWGIQLHNPNKAAGSTWVIKNFEWSNTALNFGVGYPF